MGLRGGPGAREALAKLAAQLAALENELGPVPSGACARAPACERACRQRE